MDGVFLYDDDGKPFMERHAHNETKARYTPIPDRETGAKKRLAKIMQKYPTLRAYIQGDPRGCSLYILRNEDVPGGACHAVDLNLPIVESYYSRGIPVHA